MTIAIDLSQLITAEDKARDESRAIRDQIKARRDQAMRAGITVGGITVATDDTSQQRVTGAALAAMLDPGYTVQWKAGSGFVTLTAPQVIGIAQAIRAHVQACFDREAALLAALVAGGAVDIEAGWPQS